MTRKNRKTVKKQNNHKPSIATVNNTASKKDKNGSTTSAKQHNVFKNDENMFLLNPNAAGKIDDEMAAKLNMLKKSLKEHISSIMSNKAKAEKNDKAIPAPSETEQKELNTPVFDTDIRDDGINELLQKYFIKNAKSYPNINTEGLSAEDIGTLTSSLLPQLKDDYTSGRLDENYRKRVVLAAMCLQSNSFENICDYIDFSENKLPDDIKPLYLSVKSAFLLDRKSYDYAIALGDSIKLNSGKLVILTQVSANLFNALYSNSMYNDALRFSENAMRRNYQPQISKNIVRTERFDLAIKIADCMINEENYTCALKSYDNALSFAVTTDNLYDVYCKKARILYNYLKKPEQAIACFQIASSLCPDKNYAYYERAKLYFSERDYAKSMDMIRLCIHPSAEMFDFAANVCVIADKHDDALRYASDALAKEKSVSRYCFRGNLYLKREMYKEAFDDFSEAIKIKPEMRLYAKRAFAAYELSMFNEALKDLHTAKSFPDAQVPEVLRQLNKLSFLIQLSNSDLRNVIDKISSRASQIASPKNYQLRSKLYSELAGQADELNYFIAASELRRRSEEDLNLSDIVEKRDFSSYSKILNKNGMKLSFSKNANSFFPKQMLKTNNVSEFISQYNLKTTEKVDVHTMYSQLCGNGTALSPALNVSENKSFVPYSAEERGFKK